ncbi:hypothetical protein [Chitinivibrio alkaliphilus]|uniref:Secreted protein n=1 Tax=Chitinivibrio alkaliphilus ACht1 TaxID=1313304 RepID=U7DC83_9BACT|nr:hypothetical protein [Chitinivibrio alkaliphilus]ERP32030.1 hypothetical protein CALK_1011 [Chitinivibrio alkaliphilus ACht1]
MKKYLVCIFFFVFSVSAFAEQSSSEKQADTTRQEQVDESLSPRTRSIDRGEDNWSKIKSIFL